MQTRTYKIHHGPNMGEATTFPPYTLCMAMGLALKCHFALAFPNGSPEILKIWILATLGAHNFVCRPPIEVRSEGKL
jgi:hypothetical protein